MKILIIGGSGVIGRGIDYLLSKKYEVHILNSKIYDRVKNQYNINSKINFDIFIHAGGVTDEEIKHYGKYSSIKRSSLALNKLINFLKKNNCKKFVYISSQRVYLNFYRPNISIFNERRSKTIPTTIYEKCHLLSENIFKKISKSKNIKSLIIRPGIVYGIPKENKNISRPNLIQYAFLNSLIKSNNIVIKSSGEQFRNFSINEDIGKIVLKWIEKKKNKKLTVSNAKGKILKVKNYAKMCCREYEKITKKKTKITILGKDQSNFRKFKIYQQIKFKTNVNLNLKKFIHSFLKISIKKSRNLNF
jgi:nucleoside-diphosphate-sugar epimerase